MLSAEIQKAENHVETTITLDDDINITRTIEIPVDKNIVLNLNGHTISYTGNSYVSNFTVKGTLTLIGNGTISGGTGYSRETGSSRGGLIYVSDNAVLNIGLKEQESYDILLTGNRILPGDFYSAGGGVYVGNNAKFNMYSGKISNNCVGDSGMGSGVYVESHATFNMYGGEITENHPTDDSDGYDGAVYLDADAKFDMYSGKISNNEAGNGGGVYIDNAQFHMYGGTISENLSRENVSAAAVFVKGDKSKFTMDNGLIDKNIAQYKSNNGAAIKLETGAEFVLNGGTISNTTGNGVIVDGDSFFRKPSNFVMKGGLITGNTTTGTSSLTHESGAGVLVQGDSTFTMNDGEISGNHASANGGGVYVFAGSSTFTMNDGIITRNTAGKYGGGVGVSNNSTTTFNMNGGEITGNKAAASGGGVSVIRGKFFRDGGVLCNNTATEYGDDILVKWVYPSDLKLGHVGEDWKLNGCNHAITGWYKDGKWKTSDGSDGLLDRWNASTTVDGAATEQCVDGKATYAQAIPNPFSPNYYYGDYGIKAAHGNQTYYTVTFDYNDDGTTADDVEKVLVGTSVSKPKDPERTGYTFVGWYKQNSKDPYDFNSNVYQTTVLVARWQKNPVLNYDLTGGTGADGIVYSPKEYPYGDTVTVLESPTKEDYTFVEWNTKPDGTGHSYQSGAQFTISTDTTLYAQWTPNIVIKPANITIYMGGSGYEGVVDGDGNGVVDGDGNLVSDNGFPTPGFLLTLPQEIADISISDLHLQYKEDDGTILTWKFVKYADENSNVYRIEPDGETASRNVRMNFIAGDGQIVTDDEFNIKDHLNQTLTVTIYGEGIDEGKVSFVYQNKIYGIDSGTASLTVRGTTKNVEYGKIGEPRVEGKPGLSIARGTKFYINDSTSEVTDVSGVALLFDDIINSNSTNDDRTNLLKLRVDAELEGPQSDRHYDFKYLDLVDTNNGNVWVRASQNVTVYWPLPEGTNENSNFKLLHFAGVHRSLTNDKIEDAIQNGKVEEIAIKDVTDTHLVFEVGPDEGFSPFVLVWDTTKSSGGNGGNGGGGTTTTTTNNNNTNNNTTTVNVTSTAAAQPQAATAAIPQTGDAMPVGLLGGLAAAAAAGFAALFVIRKRKQNG